MPDKLKHCILPVTVMPDKMYSLTSPENSSLCINWLWGWCKGNVNCLKFHAINPETLTGFHARSWTSWQAITSPTDNFQGWWSNELQGCSSRIRATSWKAWVENELHGNRWNTHSSKTKPQWYSGNSWIRKQVSLKYFGVSKHWSSNWKLSCYRDTRKTCFQKVICGDVSVGF